jgi:branched-chain amino acid transport system permease protein
VKRNLERISSTDPLRLEHQAWSLKQAKIKSLVTGITLFTATLLLQPPCFYSHPAQPTIPGEFGRPIQKKTRGQQVNLEGLLSLLPPTLIDGLVLGLMYSVIALGYTMVYGVLEFINFAHSEIFMFGGIVGVELLINVLPASGLHPILQLLLAIIVAAVCAGALAVAIERIAYRPLRLRNAPKLVPLISALGMSLFLQDAVRLVESLFGNYNRPFPTFAFFDSAVFQAGSARLSWQQLTICVFAGLMLLGLNYMVNYTRTGKAIRAVAQDASTSSLMGIDVTRVITVTFLIGGALGGVAGVLYAMKVGNAWPFMGFLPGTKSFTAAVLGGIGSIPGAMLGGIVLGLIETIAGTYLPLFTNDVIGNEYKDIVAFGLLIIILIFKPAGLLGKAVSEKV